MQNLYRLACAALLTSGAAADVLHVDADLTSGSNDGSSWSNAFQGPTGLQAALAASTAGDAVYVREGLYRPTTSPSPGATFLVPPAVALYGGFAGGEAGPDERPPLGAAPTVLSGDILGNDASGQYGDNCLHVVLLSPDPVGTTIDGFTLRGGYASLGGGTYGDAGGGLVVPIGGKAVVRRCTFTENWTEIWGGGLYARGSEAVIEDCLFVDNRAGGAGAGIATYQASVDLARCDFLGNRADITGPAIDLQDTLVAGIRDCRFIDNQLTGVTPGSAGAGALRLYLTGTTTVERCEFRGNLGNRGGGAEIWATGVTTILDCLFVDNVADGSTGGGAIWTSNNTDYEVINSTFVGNRALKNGKAGGIQSSSSVASRKVSNSIFWNNIGSDGLSSAQSQLSPAIDVQRSIVQFGYPSLTVLDQDPLFVDSASGDLRLGPGSPAVDAGDNTLRPTGAGSEDLAGLPRFFQQYDAPDATSSPLAVVDLGAFERSANGFTDVAGCLENPHRLSVLSAPFHVGRDLLLGYSDADSSMPGVGFVYAGRDGTTGSGCGLELPGIGELLLSFGAPLTPLGSLTTGAGPAALAAAIPDEPALVGQTFGIQLLNLIPQTGLGQAPEGELTNMLVGTLVP